MATRKKTDAEILAEKELIRQNAIGRMTAFYRLNIHRVPKELFGISTHWFQKILLYMMSVNNYFMFLASRSIGKTWLTALFCLCWAVLYPGSKIVIAAGTKAQACEVLSKIELEFWANNSAVKSVIKSLNSTPTKGIIEFHNGSYIKAVASNDNARGNRATVLIIDEFRIVSEPIIVTVLKKFIGALRDFGALMLQPFSKIKIKYQEQGKEIYMSSAWYVNHWSYNKATDFYDKMIKGRKYFICALPYQLGLQCEMFDKERIQDELYDVNFDQVSFDMEWGCIFYGSKNGNFFKLNDIEKNRVLTNPLPKIHDILEGAEAAPPLDLNERRILSVDVALMASINGKDNDAASLQVNRAMWENNVYTANIHLIDNYEGLLAQDLALYIMRYYYGYSCTDLVIDATGVGQAVMDLLMDDIVDKEYGKTYSGLTCCNNKEIASRSKKQNAAETIWSIKASRQFNSDTCKMLRSGFQLGNVRLLVDEFKYEETLIKSGKAYSKLSEAEKSFKLSSSKQTSLLINELIALKSKVQGNTVTVEEVTGMRKDRYSSLSYNYYVMKEIEVGNTIEDIDSNDNYDIKYRAPRIYH